MVTPSFISSIRQAMDSTIDPTLVENTPRLLDTLNRSDKLQRLLMKRDARGYTLLHLAAEKNQPESLKCLLIKEANPNVTSTGATNEVTPLHIAAGLGHLACLQLLVQSYGDILAVDNQQKTPLDYASLNGQELCFNYLHEQIAKRQSVEAREIEDVLTAVEQSLASDDVANLTHWQFFNDLFPLSVSAASNLSPTESLLYRRCYVNNSQNLVHVYSRLSKDIPIRLHDASLLHAASRYGRIELVRLLTECVPQIALSVTSEGYNSLHVAVAHHQEEVAKLLIEKQIKWSRRTRHLTSNESNGGNMEASGVETSLAHGAARFAMATMTGQTVLHFAVAVNNIDSLFYLLKYHRELQLSVDCRECGYTPLHLAVFLNRLEPIRMLLNKGANPNIRVDQNTANALSICRTPLAEAALNKNVQAVNILLGNGAEDRHRDAIKKCVPYNRHSELVIPLLASLVKHDDTYKPKAAHLDHNRHKYAALEWANLALHDILPNWITSCLSKVTFLRSLETTRQMECVTSVNLSNNSLQSVPAELFQLPKMAVLNLTGNRIKCLPEIHHIYNTSQDLLHEYPCSSLVKLYLNKNGLRFLPEFIFSLPNLEHVDLSDNHLRELPFDLWKAPKLHSLICSNNQIESIPTNWPQVLGTCTVIESPSPKSMLEAPQAKRRSKLELYDSIDPAPLEKEVRNPSDDTDSSSSGAPLISKLHDCLNISNSHLPVDWKGTDGREEVYEGLAILNLSNNCITQIPDNLPCLCPKLVRLDLSKNQITSISLPHTFPPELKQINLSFNQLDNIDCPSVMAKPLPCTNPQALAEAENTIYVDNVSFCTHRSHFHLEKLGVLEMTNCGLQNVNFFCPGPRNKQEDDMKKATYKAGTIVSSTGKPKQYPVGHSRLVCPLLTRLILSHNQLGKVPESICEMTSLNSLDLSHNDIIDLPAEMGNLRNLWEFPLAGLKLISPPQNIIERGKTKDIIGFLWSLLQRARPYHRMKLMLVGRADRGKTTLLAKISEKGQRGIQDNWGNTRMKGSVENISTVGIVVSDWTYFKRVKESQTALKSITFMTWDFGGQEEYYATHQCFLSRRSLYLAVWNVTHGMKGAEELKPWLLNIQARAPNSPVIIVGTHLDKLSRSGRHELQSCLEYIHLNYGHIHERKEGFPQIMDSMVVSCVKGSGISTLRDCIFDVASQVRENTVVGRGIGCGRISEYRLLMDQLVPASYLQLEDTVRNIALNMRLTGNPPVLTYKKLRNEVFSDPRTLISKNSGNRELEQAVRFLHDNGTMLHFEDPLLNDFYFVDPQWLCDMLAHIVTVREINPFVKDGVMRIEDFPLIFNDMEFPIRWKTEYIRLLTTFEVAVELGQDQLLIPSALSQEKPNLPQIGTLEELKQLPSLCHAYIIPFIPSGFWPRFMSRLIADSSIMKLAREGCAIPKEDSDQLTWVKWRTGMILQYGNLTILSIEELSGGMFPKCTRKKTKGIMVFSEEQWQQHNSSSRIFGINIEVPDIYPILKFPEAVRRYRRVNPKRGRSRLSEENLSVNLPQAKVDVPVNTSCDRHVTNRMVSIDQIDSEFEKLRNRLNMSRNNTAAVLSASGGSGHGMGVVRETLNGRISPVPPGIGGGGGGGIQRTRSFNKSGSKPSSPSSQLPKPLLASIKNSPTPDTSYPGTIPVTEEKNDIMRAGLLSKAVDHITLLMDDWFMGARPRTIVVPCPHCSHGVTPPVKMERSYSEVLDLLPSAEREELSVEGLEDDSCNNPFFGTMGLLNNELEGQTEHPHSSLFTGFPDDFNFAYRYNDCVVSARKYNSMYCPSHGQLPLQYMAPDTLFLTEGRDILVDSKDLERKESIGRGAFATVFRANYKSGQEIKEVALKSMTKEWRTQSQEPGHQNHNDGLYEEQDVRSLLMAHPPSRHSIIAGFTNLKKELSILSPLRHPHVVQLFGVMLRPMGLVLELAPLSSLKKILNNYHEVDAKLHVRAMQRVLLQVASAIEYLHSSSIIYRDLKSDNILVWKFPEPYHPIPISLGSDMGMESVKVKLSDYGISQFVATQGARGLVGTPGFIAPEIIKYHGKEVYNKQVDIFSFGMFIYELLTLHIPYETLAVQQANQANERGTRPSLSKADFPCPVLVRELMVWCWQQLPDNRPSADSIIALTQKQQFPRLLDGIRICNSGQVTVTCMRVISSGQSVQRRESRILTPPTSAKPTGSPQSLTSLTTTSMPQLEVVSEEGRWSDNVFGGGSPLPPLTSSLGDTPFQVNSTGGGSSGSSPDPTRVPTENCISDYPSEKLNSLGVKRRGSDCSLGYRHIHSRLQWQNSCDELLVKRLSPYYYMLEEERPMAEVWVASSNARHSVITVVDYNQRFLNIEDMEVGDSPVLSLCLANKKVWIGMEIGCLLIYDANSRKPYLQSWIKRYRKIQSIVYISSLHSVYLGLDDGSVIAYNDELPAPLLTSSDHTLINPPLISLSPIAQYRDSTQSTTCILPLSTHSSTLSNQSSNSQKVSMQLPVSSYELWVGQKGNRITVLDAASLKVVKFLNNSLDKSIMPSYIAYLSYSHLVCGGDSERGVASGKREGCDYVSVYSALHHGQYVTRWNTVTKCSVDSFDCRPHAEGNADCSISALLYSRMELFVGLSCGLILVVDPLSFAVLCSLSCHRKQVFSLLSLNFSTPCTSNTAPPTTQQNCPSSKSSSDNPSPTNVMTPTSSVSRLSPLGCVQKTAAGSGNRLLSFGSGFKSYYDGPECKQHHDAGFLLVWESDSWQVSGTNQ